MSHPSKDALFVALVLAPGTYSRNKYFGLFQEETSWMARRRAQMVRSMVRDLTEPWPLRGAESKATGPDFYAEKAVGDQVFVEYTMSDLDYRRSAVLTRLEAATLHYALSQTGQGEVAPDDIELVERALQDLAGMPLASEEGQE